MSATAPIRISGDTRIIPMIGHPVGQVHLPEVLNPAFLARGINAVMLAMDITPAALPDFARMLGGLNNAPGCVITLPHKGVMAGLLNDLSSRARLLGAVNVIRRQPEGCLYGDMLDGEGMVAALDVNGVRVAGSRIWVIGAGGAGSAIALALCEAGAATVHISDKISGKSAALAGRLNGVGRAVVGSGIPESLKGIDILINASPQGMDGQGMPVPAEFLATLSSTCHIADAVTRPRITPLVAAARARGLSTQTGDEMAAAQADAIARFLGLWQ